MLPFNRKSRLLAPTENVNSPSGLRHPCATTSHTERSYRDSVTVTVSPCPAPRRTSVKPRSTLGGSPALEGKCRYSCGICTRCKRRRSRYKIKNEEGRTSPPATLPVFFTSNDNSNAGRCSHSAVELPSPEGPALPAAQSASSAANVLSDGWTARAWRFE